MKSLGKIQRYDVNGVQLQEGDIVACGKVGKNIWDGTATILRRPIGIVYFPKEHPVYWDDLCIVEENDCYNVKEIRPGEAVAIKGKAEDWMLKNLCDENGRCYFHLSTYDGDFYGWDSIEKIGSIYDFK